MDDWKEYVKLEVSDASTDVFRLLQITVAINDMKEIDLIPVTTHTEIIRHINAVNKEANGTDHD